MSPEMTNLCPICKTQTAFRNFRGRRAAQCPTCGSLERHRLVWHFWQTRTNLFDGQPKTMLHMAPEACFRGRLSKQPGITYLSGDLSPVATKAHVRLDLTRLALPNDAYDVFHVSHVLEHISDDLQAARELRRVTRVGGWGVIQVPLRRNDRTFVDPRANTPVRRKQAYGQHNHVRIYGELDLKPLLESAGFAVEGIVHGASLPEELITLYSVSRDEMLFFCYRPPLSYQIT